VDELRDRDREATLGFSAVADQDETAAAEEYNDGSVSLTAVRHPAAIETGEPFAIELELEVKRPIEQPIVALSFSTVAGHSVVANTSATDGLNLRLEVGRNVLHVAYDELPLTRGIYGVNVVIAERSINNQMLAALKRSIFEVRVPRGDLGAGVLHLRPSWSNDVVDAASVS
jgi:hypothetical protein